MSGILALGLTRPEFRGRRRCLGGCRLLESSGASLLFFVWKMSCGLVLGLIPPESIGSDN